jgi:hypothetical protein
MSSRRDFLEDAGWLAMGGVAVASIPGILMPRAAFAQAAPNPASDAPISWTCPMVGLMLADGTLHPDVLQPDKGDGKCPICKMDLVPIRLEAVWTCPVHAVVAQAQPGKCPIDKVRDLVQVIVSVSYTCANHPEIDELNPGKCPGDGSPMIVKRSPRPHGNHNPQHGGMFFMAPDSWHHIEGTMPAPGIFRAYFYDDFAKVLPADQLRAVKGRIVTKETFDPKTKQTIEHAAFPLVLSPDGKYFEAKIDVNTVPAQMAAKIQFKPTMKEDRFDFQFQALSKEPK